MSEARSDVLLSVEELRTWFEGHGGVRRAVDGVSFTLARGETLGLVGESGSGKSVTALSILGLVPPPGRVAGGRVLFAGRDLLALPAGELRRLRGKELAMVFQEPMTALNPVYTVGEQIVETVRCHLGLGAAAARVRALEMLAAVGIPAPRERIDSWPHELSGGMRQRVLLAMAMCCEPALLLADEPTTALDVTVQAQILELVRDLQRRQGTAVLLITHDLGVVAESADRVCVMYAGRIVEQADVWTLFERPRHPYTLGLLRSQPHLARAGEPLLAIPGAVPDPERLPSGCAFRTRCPLARERCALEEPRLRALGGGQLAACHFAEEVGPP
jgi:oligopeptide/dipeptide ABC transporter ATP-binding protein